MPEAPKPVPWYKSHRVWSVITTVGGLLTTQATPVVTGVNPVAGVVVKLLGLALTVAGGAGMAYYGITSNRAVQFKNGKQLVAP